MLEKARHQLKEATSKLQSLEGQGIESDAQADEPQIDKAA